MTHIDPAQPAIPGIAARNHTDDDRRAPEGGWVAETLRDICFSGLAVWALFLGALLLLS